MIHDVASNWVVFPVQLFRYWRGWSSDTYIVVGRHRRTTWTRDCRLNIRQGCQEDWIYLAKHIRLVTEYRRSVISAYHYNFAFVGSILNSIVKLKLINWVNIPFLEVISIWHWFFVLGLCWCCICFLYELLNIVVTSQINSSPVTTPVVLVIKFDAITCLTIICVDTFDLGRITSLPSLTWLQTMAGALLPLYSTVQLTYIKRSCSQLGSLLSSASVVLLLHVGLLTENSIAVSNNNPNKIALNKPLLIQNWNRPNQYTIPMMFST